MVKTLRRRPGHALGQVQLLAERVHQLQHLVSVTKELPNVTIQIAPFSIGPYTGMKGAFEHVHFEDTPDDDIVFLSKDGGIVSGRQAIGEMFTKARSAFSAEELDELGERMEAMKEEILTSSLTSH